MRRRLDHELNLAIYQHARSNLSWPDHELRTLVTGGAVAFTSPKTVCDPACGDASILSAAYKLRPFEKAYLSDISVPSINKLRPDFPFESKVSDLFDAVAALDHVDTIVLTETLEHIEDPDRLLELAATKADALVASSPILEPSYYDNPEHIWEWDVEGYEQMLRATGWKPATVMTMDFPMLMTGEWAVYQFQVWTAKR